MKKKKNEKSNSKPAPRVSFSLPHLHAWSSCQDKDLIYVLWLVTGLNRADNSVFIAYLHCQEMVQAGWYDDYTDC